MKKWLMTGGVCLAAVLLGFTGECRAETVDQQTVLKGVESGAGVPEKILVECDGVKEYVPVKDIRVLREYWTEDFEFPVLFYVYDAEYYELGDYRIPREESGPGLGGYEDGLLAALGLDGDDYVIETVDWDGDAYVNEEGIQCRDAVARGRKRVRDVEVVYTVETGTAKEPDAEVPDRDVEETQVMAEAPDQVKRVADIDYETSGGSRDLWTILRKVTVVTVALGLVLLLLFGLLLLCMKAVRWWRERKKEKKRKDVFDYYG